MRELLLKQDTVCVRYRGRKLEDQRRVLLLLTAFLIGDSEISVPFCLERSALCEEN